MCQDRNKISVIIRGKTKYIDKCIAARVGTTHLITLASCCGHGRYPKTLIIRRGKRIIEQYSQKEILRIRRFYQKDKEGYYFIPETLGLA